MIELNMLRYVLAAAETGSFSQAASRFGIKQATLSQSVLYLEDRLGLPLFTRSTRGVSPTLPARRIIDRARRIVDDLDRLLLDSRALAEGRSGTLRIGFSGSVARGALAATVNQFRLVFPGVIIEAREADKHELLGAVERGALDVAVTGRATMRAGLRMLSLWSEPIEAALATNHRLAAADPLHWSDLRGARLVLPKRDPGPDIAMMLPSRLAGPGISPDVTCQDVSHDSLVAFAVGDHIVLGVGLPSPTTAQRYALRQVHDPLGPTHCEQYLYWHGEQDFAALRNFVSLTHTIVAGRPT